jgi:choline dehydrogenase-like flavoprotein
VGFIKACEAANIPIVDNLNKGNNTGVKQGTGCLDSRYRRSSSYDSFYKQAANRTNLNVLHYAPVQSILFTDNGTGTPTATGVAFIDEPTGLIHQVSAKKEAIVSMGAFHSPKLLMVLVN